MAIWSALKNVTSAQFVQLIVILALIWSDRDNEHVVPKEDGQDFHQAVN